jgi:hypothetical protein
MSGAVLRSNAVHENRSRKGDPNSQPDDPLIIPDTPDARACRPSRDFVNYTKPLNAMSGRCSSHNPTPQNIFTAQPALSKGCE